MFKKIIILFLLLCTNSYAYDLFNWDAIGDGGDDGSGWSGWTYNVNADDFGSPGWRKDDGQFYSGGGTSNWQARSAENHEYGGASWGKIDTSFNTPYSNGGGTFYVKNIGGTDVNNRPAWWMHISGSNYGTLGFATVASNRLDFYIYNTGIIYESTGYTPYSNFRSYNTHIATYTCDGSECVDRGGDGEGGYAEGWHYYHHGNYSNNIWWHTQLSMTPEHARTPVADPYQPLTTYYYYMSGFYIEHFQDNEGGEFWIDDIRITATTESENDESTGTISIGYNSTTGKWQIVWHDNSFTAYGTAISNSTFDIRWSPSIITNSNFSSATQIEPEYYEVGETNLVRRGNPNFKPGWTQFDLPAGTELNYNILYFAIKDVSETGEHIGSFPYGSGDGHDAPNSYIRTIDYKIRYGRKCIISNVGTKQTITPTGTKVQIQ